ncbi:PEP-CTERM protein-sorting domain-containing protein [Nitrosomonas eutropha]|uniref:PEP-CTERM sorting domain-containing protein n=1 Tax=Nitrosomonas eutropha TaxID=916 RepID=UPI0008850D19|nr:PEP-CTERM sorting domain-containing protein [Nitrosomonas eutropha]SCX06920.1 PEP-CTERM protein-sorting domain-containing protein [Nitrosomonas eutropha]
MKKRLINGVLVSVVTFAFSIPVAHAVPYTIDTLLGSAALANSGDTTELNYIKQLTGDSSLELDFKIEKNDVGFNVATNGTGSWFIDVAPDTPGYFMLKFGVGSTSVTADHYVFKNIGELTKLVWSNDQVNFLTGGDCGANNSNACNIGRLSHYVGTNGNGGGGSSEIPEPVSLLLFGAGLLGLGLNRRRKQA